MDNKNNNEREELDNNETIKKLLKEHDNKMEIAKEVSTNKKVAEVLGDRLARKRRFPPC